MDAEGSVVDGFTVGGLIARTPAVVWSITAAWLGLLFLWSVLPPIFFAPDEPQHIDAVVDAADRPLLEWIAPTADRMGTAIAEATEQYGFFAPGGDLDERPERRLGQGRSAAEARPRDARPTHSQLLNSDGIGRPAVNQMAQHPPLAYRVDGLLLAALPDWRNLRFDVLVGLLRLLTVLTMAPLPVLLADLARTLDGRPVVSAAAAVSPLVIPQIAHLGSAVTNDALLVVLAVWLALLLARIHRGDASTRTANWVGGVLLSALLTKAFALFLPIAVVAAYVGCSRRPNQSVSTVWRPLVRSAVISSLSLVWYGENLIRFGSLQPSVGAPIPPPVQGALADYLPRALQVQVQTFWGRFGWAETGFTVTTAIVASIVLVLLVVIGLWGRDLLEAAMLLVPGTLVAVITVVQSYSYFGLDDGIRAIQGRYFYISIAGALVLAVMGTARLLGRQLSAWTWVPVLMVGAGMQASAWVLSIGHFWTTADAPALADGLRAMLAWQPWPPRLVQASAVVTALIAIDTLRRLIPMSRTPDPTNQALDTEQHAGRQEDHIPAT